MVRYFKGCILLLEAGFLTPIVFLSLNMEKNETENIVRIIKGHFPEIEAIYLFGSQADGFAAKDSDVDVAFFTLYGNTVTDVQVYEAQKDLEVSLNKDVDLIHLNKASTVFQFQVVISGIPLYVNKPSSLLLHEAMVMSMYQRLNEERKYILQDIGSSGKIYSS